MLQTLKTLQRERIVNVKELQKSPSKHLKGITRVLRGSATLGYFLDQSAFDDFIEDLEAMASVQYTKRIQKARTSKGAVSLDAVMARYGV